ncbi:EamA family transporter [Risungbinella massiliensis]|uniref:EamA family transporter n=1 Tax=Risungbinella massiliensis TaxID=1329796 RepID=UPI00069B7D8E|nr:DMT family transporter [Risungbinella massiliensis]
MSRLRASLYVLIGASFYGMTGVITKFAYGDGYNASQVAAGQVLFGTLLLWIFAFRDWKAIRDYPKKKLWILIISGAFPTLTTIVYYIAIERLGPSLAIILLFQFTWMGVVVESVRTKQAPSAYKWLSVSVILIGTYFAAGIQIGQLDRLDLIGFLCGLLAAIGYTGFIFASGSLGLGLPPTLRGAWLNTGSLMLILALYSPTVYTDGALIEGLWKWGLILGISGAFLPSFLFTKAIPHLGSGVASLLGSVELPVAILAAALLLQEEVSLFRWSGVVVILFGIWLAEYKSKSPEKHSSRKPEPEA